MSDDSGVTLALLRQMLNANDPEEVARHAREWKDLARELYEVLRDVDGVLSDIDGSFDSQQAAPALKAKLIDAMSDLDVTAGRIDRNANVIDQAADAHRRARDAANNASSDSDAQPIRSALSEEHAALAAQLDLFNDEGIAPGKPPLEDAGGSNGSAGGGPGSSRTNGGGFVVPPSGTGTRGTPFASRFNPGPMLGGRTPVDGGKPGPAAGRGASGARIGTGGGSGAGTRGGRVGLPGGRSGVPIGGYRPVASTPGAGGAGGGSTPPGGSTPGKAGPGGPGRPGGAVPPGGTGPGQPGRDRPGRRLTNYEKLEPNVFRDTRHRVKPVIGEQRGQPDTFDPTPGAIGGKQTGGETRKAPDMPTRESPMRFEGHDMSVSRRSRRAGP